MGCTACNDSKSTPCDQTGWRGDPGWVEPVAACFAVVPRETDPIVPRLVFPTTIEERVELHERAAALHDLHALHEFVRGHFEKAQQAKERAERARDRANRERARLEPDTEPV